MFRKKFIGMLNLSYSQPLTPKYPSKSTSKALSNSSILILSVHPPTASLKTSGMITVNRLISLPNDYLQLFHKILKQIDFLSIFEREDMKNILTG